MSLNQDQLDIIDTAVRISASLSILGGIVILGTFLTWERFRTTANRLLFVMTIGDLSSALVKFLGQGPIGVGSVPGALTEPYYEYIKSKPGNSPSCITQAFFVTWGELVSVMITAFMSLNVVLVVLRNWTSVHIQKNERYYFSTTFIVATILAIVPLVINDPVRGPVYGNATLWCWIRDDWGILRVILFYCPIIFIFLFNCVAYVLVGKKISDNSKILRDTTYHGPPSSESPLSSSSTTTKVSFSNSANRYMRIFAFTVLIYLSAFFFSWSFGIINRIVGLVRNPKSLVWVPTNTNSPPPTTSAPAYLFCLYLLHGIMVSGRGMINFSAYFIVSFSNINKSIGGDASESRSGHRIQLKEDFKLKKLEKVSPNPTLNVEEETKLKSFISSKSTAKSWFQETPEDPKKSWESCSYYDDNTENFNFEEV